jgi:AmmeMemoRadiSam system protein B
MNLMLKIREAAQEKNIPTVLQTEPSLDYGAAVPLYYLTKHLPKVKIMPISFSLLNNKTHLDFGYLIKEQIMSSNERVAVIASADLAHTLKSESPAGFSPQARVFDDQVIENLKNHNTSGLLNLEPNICSEAAECGLRSILILLGILQRVNYDLKILSYEGPLGIGYLTANFILK